MFAALQIDFGAKTRGVASVPTKTGNQLLLEQIDKSRLEMKQMQEAMLEERKVIKLECAQKLAVQEKQLKNDLNAVRAEFASLEDKYALQTDELDMSLAKVCKSCCLLGWYIILCLCVVGEKFGKVRTIG